MDRFKGGGQVTTNFCPYNVNCIISITYQFHYINKVSISIIALHQKEFKPCLCLYNDDPCLSNL